MRVRLSNGQEVYEKRLRRREQPGHRLLTFSCFRKCTLFVNDRIKDAFRDHLATVMAESSAELVAWVIMPDHVHLLVRSDPATCTMRHLTHAVKMPFAKCVIARWRALDAPVLALLLDGQTRTRFWEHGGGHDRNLIRPRELAHKITYIHENPVRAHFCTEPIDYPWSSARAYAGLPCPRVIEIPSLTRSSAAMSPCRTGIDQAVRLG